MEIKSISIALIFVAIMTILGPSIIGVGEMADNQDDNDSGWIKKLMKKPLLLDGRNIYDPKIMEELGFSYMGVGR